MRRLAYIHLAVFGMLFVLPHVAHAATANFFGPIIPDACNCTNPVTANGVTVSSSAPSWGCVLQVIQNLMNAFVSFATVIITLFIAYAGFTFILSPANEEKRSQARTRIVNAVLGLLIVLSAWLVVDSIMKVLYSSDRFGPWNNILVAGSGTTACIQPQNPPSALPSIGVTNTNTQNANGAGGTAVGSTGSTGNGTLTTVSGNPTYSASSIATRAKNASNYMSQICAAAAANGISNQGSLLAGILGVESNGKATATSGVGAIGLMQLEPDTAAQYGVTACKGSSRSSPSAACLTALQDPQTNINAGTKYVATLLQQTGGNINNTIAAYNGGIKATQPSTNCPGQTSWQCTINTHYAETRAYVPNVEAVASQLGGCP